MAMARETRENRDRMTGDSVCSTLSDCSLLERNHFHGKREKRYHPLESRTDCLVTEDTSDAVEDDLDNIRTEEHGELSATFGGDEKKTDNATFRSVVMRQFKDDIDRLMHTVAQKVENSRGTGAFCVGSVSGGACQLSSPNQPNIYSVVKSGCLSLLLSRVLPPLQEQFEQRLMDSLHTAGLLPPASATCQQQHRPAIPEDPRCLDSPRHQPQRPQPPPMPAPRPRTTAKSWLNQPQPSLRLTELCPHSAPPDIPSSLDTNHFGSQHQPQLLFPHPLPRPAPRLLTSSESATATRAPPPLAPRLTQSASLHLPPPPGTRQCNQYQGQNRISSPYFVHPKSATGAANARTPTSAVRNNSSLKPASNAAPPKVSLPLHRIRQPPTPPPSLSPTPHDLVHTFLIRDSPMLRTILFDPDDRKIKSFSQRYGCYINLYEKTRRAGHLLHKVVVRAPSEKALRMCISALDSGLNWDLASQLNRTNKKPVPSLAK